MGNKAKKKLTSRSKKGEQKLPSLSKTRIEETVMEKESVCYFLLEHTPLQETNPSQFGLFLYKLDADDINTGADFSRPLGQPIFCFAAGKYPKGMSCGVLEGKLYFVGGYFPHEINASEDDRPNYSNDVYILDPTLIEVGSPEEGVENALNVVRCPEPINKKNPIVLTVKEKLYVLPRRFGAEYEIHPCIQSYDPYQDKWDKYDIFALLESDIFFSFQPKNMFWYEVLTHCVRDNEIIVVLYVGAYSFNVDTRDLKLIGKHSRTMDGAPFRGLAAVVDGCFIGLSRDCLLGFAECPLGLISYETQSLELLPPGVLVHKCPRDLDMGFGMVIQIPAVKESNLLVVRSGVWSAPYTNRFLDETNLIFDFLCIAKDSEGYPKCSRARSIIYHVDEDARKYHSFIIACILIQKTPGRKNTDVNRDLCNFASSAPKYPDRYTLSRGERRGMPLWPPMVFFKTLLP